MDTALSSAPVLVVAAKGGVKAVAAKRSSVTISQLVDAISQAVSEAIRPVNERLDEMEERFADIEARLAGVESRPSPFRYRGVWTEGEYYAAGDFCTQGGSLWAAERLTMAKPGGEHSGWRLAVKSGKTGRSVFDIARALGKTNAHSEREWYADLVNQLKVAAINAGRGN